MSNRMKSLEEKTISSKNIYKGNLLDLRKDKVLLPNNKISLSQMEPHKKLHKILFDNHQTLSMSFNFQHIVKPLI